MRSAWVALKMADDINLAVGTKEQVSYFGLGLVLVWRKHKRVFPDEREIRTRYKRYAIRALAWWFITLIVLIALAAFVR